MRIAVGGFLHESHSFAPRPTRYGDFVQPGGFPPLCAGDRLLPTLQGTSVPAAGAIAAAGAAGATVVPLAWCIANPAGPVQPEAFERIAGRIVGALSAALDAAPLDGVFLDLHGAMVAEDFPDAEGELLRRVRAAAGATPIAASLDPHANLTRQMVAQADLLVPYLTYPHVDMPATGARAIHLLLARIARCQPFARAYRQVEFWMPITSQCTLVEPMAGLMRMRAALVGGEVAELAWCFGFPYADFADCGPALAAYADTQAAADHAADAMLAAVARSEMAFAPDVLPAADAVARALAEIGPGGPVVIADTQDNPGGGGHGDTTGLLAELIRQGARGAVLCHINDAESAAQCHRAGEGARLTLSLGGKSDGAPLATEARILRLADGRFTLTGPMGCGNPADLGPCALIELESGIRVVVISRKMQALDQAILRHVGVEPAEAPILALKSSVHFRADFGPIARAVIVAAAPGPVVADPATLPFRHVRPGIRMRPGSNHA